MAADVGTGGGDVQPIVAGLLLRHRLLGMVRGQCDEVVWWPLAFFAVLADSGTSGAERRTDQPALDGGFGVSRRDRWALMITHYFGLVTQVTLGY